jgi:6-phosphogluconolactonase
MVFRPSPRLPAAFAAVFYRPMKSRVWLSLILLAATVPLVSAAEYWTYFGTYTGTKSKGIYVARFNSTTGKLGAPELAAETKNPSFLAAHPNRPLLYAVGEMETVDGKKGGAVTAFLIDPATGKLTQLNQVSSVGGGPCHLAVESTGRCLMVANYGGGSVASIPIKANGGVADAMSFIQHTGSSVNKSRQAGPHGHCIVPSPDNRFALACDLGLDKVLIYKLDAGRRTLVANDPAFGETAPGAGPRHIAFHPNGKFAYVINELNCTMTTFAWDGVRGALTAIDAVSTLPVEQAKGHSTAEVQVHPNGKFVYGSNRGHDSISVFKVDDATGKLTLVQNESTQGKTPRHFALDPTGAFLFAENQGSDSVVVFAVDAKSGQIKPTGQTVNVGAPVCAVFVPVK